MVFNCPFTDCGYNSRKYPRSAAIRALQTHFKDTHPAHWAAYRRRREQERQEQGFIDRLINGSQVEITDVDPVSAGSMECDA